MGEMSGALPHGGIAALQRRHKRAKVFRGLPWSVASFSVTAEQQDIPAWNHSGRNAQAACTMPKKARK
jgi:hypothetical protein